LVPSKTTIPILSNLLVEARDGRVTRVERAHFVRRQGKKKKAPALFLQKTSEKGHRMSATGTAREKSQAMEFSVTKSVLLNELNTTQGVTPKSTPHGIAHRARPVPQSSKKRRAFAETHMSTRKSCSEMRAGKAGRA
jgi:hypothetical protein